MRIHSSVTIIVLALFFNGCASVATHPSLLDQTRTPLVPVHNYVADLDGNGEHQLSPDGNKLLWVARSGFGPAIFVKDMVTGKQHVAYKGFGRPMWAYDSRTLLIMAGKDGDENIHIYQIDTNDPNSKPVDLTPFKGATSYINKRIKDSADLLIESNKRDPKRFDLYYYKHDTAEMMLLEQNPGDVAAWITDKQGHVLGRVRQINENNTFEHLQQDASGKNWVKIFSWNAFETVHLLDITNDKKSAWVLSNRGRDKVALVKMDFSDGRETVFFEDPRVDVSNAVISDKTSQPLMAIVEPDYQEIHFFDDKLRTAFANLSAGKRVNFNLMSHTDDENVITAKITDDHGVRNVMYDISRQKLTVLGEGTRSRLDRITPLSAHMPISYTSRDGLTIHGYLTLPTIVAPKKLPTVLWVHGGPWARDTWDTGLMPQFLANRGYAVLQMNYRGSVGYGQAFRDKAIGEFAGKMHNDVVDGADWLVSQGIADPAKIAIAGVSYGGYEALVGLTFTPDEFACGVDFVGPTDLARLLETAPPYWDAGMFFWHKFTGDPTDSKQRQVLNDKSPLFHVMQIQKPLLVLHGVNDPRVKIEQSRLLIKALKENGKEVEYVEFKGDGHGNQKWNNNLTLYRKMESFLGRCLGGRDGGFDYYQLASWMF